MSEYKTTVLHTTQLKSILNQIRGVKATTLIPSDDPEIDTIRKNLPLQAEYLMNKHSLDKSTTIIFYSDKALKNEIGRVSPNEITRKLNSSGYKKFIEFVPSIKQVEKNTTKKLSNKLKKEAASAAKELDKKIQLEMKLEKNATRKTEKEAAAAAKELDKKMKLEMKLEKNATRKTEKEAAAAWKNAQHTAYNNLTVALGKPPRIANSQRLARIRYAGSTLSVKDYLKVKNAKNKTRKHVAVRENVRNIAPSFNVCEQCELKKLLESS